MEIIVLVHVGQALESLIHNIPNLMLRKQPLALFHQLINIKIEVLKDEMERGFFKDDFVELHDVGVVQFHERLDLALGDAGVPFVVFLFHFFYGDDFT